MKEPLNRKKSEYKGRQKRLNYEKSPRTVDFRNRTRNSSYEKKPYMEKVRNRSSLCMLGLLKKQR